MKEKIIGVTTEFRFKVQIPDNDSDGLATANATLKSAMIPDSDPPAFDPNKLPGFELLQQPARGRGDVDIKLFRFSVNAIKRRKNFLRLRDCIQQETGLNSDKAKALLSNLIALDRED